MSSDIVSHNVSGILLTFSIQKLGQLVGLDPKNGSSFQPLIVAESLVENILSFCFLWDSKILLSN